MGRPPKTPKAEKAPRKRAKTRADAPGATVDNPMAVAGHNEPPPSRLTPDDERALFLKHREAWARYQNKLATAEEYGKDVKAALKADGFKVGQMVIADDLAKPKGELKQTEMVTDRLRVARWVGHPMGVKQLDLFLEPDRTPSVDRAFDQGKQASMEGALKKPPYSPETEQYRSWMAGFDADQDRLRQTVGRGPQPPVTTKEGDAVQGGTPVSRAEFHSQLQENAKEVDDKIKGNAPGTDTHN